ncbi:MAG: glycerol-3-phosphate 1-O-acyltransferase PlsY [Candidatus Omnitrophota bacterium]|jgi:glycerol-3-phosphate acyltransferase PlsY
MINAFSAIFLSYLLGAIPFSFILGRLFAGVDIRRQGSGNIGSTNLVRCAGRPIGIAGLVLDISKGIVVVTIIADIFYSKGVSLSPHLFKMILGCSAVAGHIWTVFLKFKGGKGVATAIGVLAGLSPLAVVFAAAVWIITLSASKYVSLSSILMAICLPVIMYLSAQPAEYVVLALILCLLIVYKHRNNIDRLVKGTEYKFGQRSK